jgi:hypothetical protein
LSGGRPALRKSEAGAEIAYFPQCGTRNATNFSTLWHNETGKEDPLPYSHTFLRSPEGFNGFSLRAENPGKISARETGVKRHQKLPRGRHEEMTHPSRKRI